MAAILKEEIKLDTSQHEKGLRDATQSIGKYKKNVDEANKTIKGFQGNISSASSSISGMVSAFRSGDIMGFATSAKNASGALTALIPTIGATTGAVGGLGAAINIALGPVGLAVAAISGVVAVGVAAAKSVEEFNVSVKDLSSLTGMVGQDLKDIGDSAIDLSMKFGTSANSIVDSFKLIGSQAPQLLQDKEGLEAVTEAALVLSKAAGIEVEDAAKGITTVMNQMGVSAEEATGIINSLAAGSKNGAGDVAYLQTAIEKSGTQASSAGLSYQQLIGTIETLAPKFSSAEVAGTSLSGTLVRLTTQSNNEFNPAIVGLDKALENLDKANLSASDKLKIFGQSNLAAANTLIENREALADMTKAVTDTNTAYDQMETKGGSLDGSFAKLKASWNAFMIVLGESAPIQAILGYIKLMIAQWTAFIQTLVKVQRVVNEVVQVVCALVAKMWNDYIKPVWEKIAKAITDSAIFKAATKLWNSLLDAVHKVFNQIAKWWNDFKKWLGLEGNAEVTVKQNVSVTGETVGTDLGTVDGTVGTASTPNVKGGTNGSAKGGTSGTSGIKGGTTQKPPTKGSLADTEAQITELTAKLKNTDTKDTATIDALKKQIADLQAVADKQKIALGITVDSPDGSLKDIQEQLRDAKTELTLVNPEDTEKVKEIQKKISELTTKENQIKINLGLDPTEVEGSLKDIQNQISKANTQLQILNPEDTEAVEALKKKIQELTEQEKQIKITLGLVEVKPEAVEGSLKYIQNKISECKAIIDISATESPEYKQAIEQLKILTQQEQKIQVKIETDSKTPDILSKEKADTIKKANKDMYDGFKNSWGAATGLADSIDDISQGFEDMSALEIIESIGNTIFSVIDNISTLISSIQGISSAIQSASAVQSAASAASVASSEAETTASLANTAAKSGEAIASATASGASMPFPANIAAIAAGVAAVIGVIASIASFAKFADGGVVGGSATTIGDYNLIRANKGEMILNGKQQAHLFRMLDGTTGGGIPGGEVSFKISGKNLVGVLSNYNSKKAKVL